MHQRYKFIVSFIGYNSLSDRNKRKKYAMPLIRRIKAIEVRQPCKIFNGIVQTPAQMGAVLK